MLFKINNKTVFPVLNKKHINVSVTTSKPVNIRTWSDANCYQWGELQNKNWGDFPANNGE